ncbi:MAG: NfeD family protein [Bacteroidaceae bacterium]|nr:NfeD family protein [Bacteroidaceae bacterium]
MEYAITALMVLLATVLLVVEILFIPGVGVSGIMGILSMVGSVFYAFYIIGDIAGWVTLAVASVICLLLVLWALYGNTLDRVALKKNIDSKVDTVDVAKFAVGDKGVARTRLALMGEAEINGVITEVKSENGFIDEGEAIEVSRLSGDSVFVRSVNK